MSEQLLKRCSRGDNCVHPMGCWQPATPEFFPTTKRIKSGLCPWCKACTKSYNKEYRSRSDAKIAQRERLRKWRVDNRERDRATARARYAKNPLRQLQSNHLWTENHREQHRSLNREWFRIHRHKAQVYHSRRRARELDLPNQFAIADWDRAIGYFNHRCAVCGRSPDEQTTLAADHWIPLASPECPGTLPTNIVPLCHGVGGCNNSKHDQPPKAWLERRYGSAMAQEIIERVEAYFAWVKEQ